MGVLINGEWHEDGQVQTDSRGSFVRDDSIFRNWITADGAPGFSGKGGFNAEAGRYHLFVSPSCPWAHRAMILRKLKRLEDVVSMSSADRPKSAGWSYSGGIDDLEAGNDGIFRLHQVYTAAKQSYTGKVTVPTLWDRQRRTIVNNESSEIIPHVQLGLRRPDRGQVRLLSGRPARRDRPHQRLRLRAREQRRVPRRLRQVAGGLRRRP